MKVEKNYNNPQMSLKHFKNRQLKLGDILLPMTILLHCLRKNVVFFKHKNILEWTVAARSLSTGFNVWVIV